MIVPFPPSSLRYFGASERLATQCKSLMYQYVHGRGEMFRKDLVSRSIAEFSVISIEKKIGSYLVNIQ
jgi:hypothetical protein